MNEKQRNDRFYDLLTRQIAVFDTLIHTHQAMKEKLEMIASRLTNVAPEEAIALIDQAKNLEEAQTSFRKALEWAQAGLEIHNKAVQ